MALSASDIDKIVKLARLNIDLQAKEKLLRDLNNLLARMEIINAIEADSEENFASIKRGASLSKPNSHDPVIDIDSNKI